MRQVNKKTLESLIQAGAFDSLPGHRAQDLENLDRAVAFGQAAQESNLHGQSSLFEGAPTGTSRIQSPALLPCPEWSEIDRLTREKAVLGFYVSGHPLLKYAEEIRQFATVGLGNLAGFRTGGTVRACGIITSVKKKIDKRNNTMAFVGIEDFTGKAECIVFSDPYQKYQSLLRPDAMVMVVGRGEVNGEVLKILANEVYPIERVREKFTRSVVLSLNLRDLNERTISDLKAVMQEHRGTCPCYFHVHDKQRTRVYRSTMFTVEPTEKFMERVSQMLGPQAIQFRGEPNVSNGVPNRKGMS
jgi:DNA polymerase-3 subunit alpha